uniref:Uncharacterized protein n=1 Tax=Kalanchoe fedtschenkoi TaxID=63787 RepID=A0A7N0UZE2_KALFE
MTGEMNFKSLLLKRCIFMEHLLLDWIVKFKLCNLFLFQGLFEPLFVKDAHQGAATTTCYVSLQSQVKAVSVEYFTDCNLSKPSPEATDMDLAKKLWDITSSLIK